MITLATLKDATEQQVFDQVASHLLIQNERAEYGGACVYHLELSDRTLKCAAGCLISDEEYDPEFEDSCWENLAATERVTDHHSALIAELQGCHDDTDPVDWPELLYEIAARWELSPAVVRNRKASHDQ